MKLFESPNYLMKVHDDLLIEFLVRKNATLQACDVWASREQSLSYISGQKFLVLFEGDHNANISGDARRAGASALYAEHVAAVAIYSPRSYERIMSSLYLKINKPITPTRFFEKREEAIAWLRLQNPLRLQA